MQRLYYTYGPRTEIKGTCEFLLARKIRTSLGSISLHSKGFSARGRCSSALVDARQGDVNEVDLLGDEDREEEAGPRGPLKLDYAEVSRSVA